VPTFSADVVLAFAHNLFRAGGIPDDEADRVARSLVDANLAGHDSHGLIRIPQYLQAVADGKMKSGVPLSILRETPSVLCCDGNWGIGQVQAHRLLARLVPMARRGGLAAGTLKHCGHIGRLGEYAEAATAEGVAFFASVNNHGFGRAVAPPGGTTGVIGTNPLCLAAPTTGDPIVLDIGTSVCAEGKVCVLHNKGEKAPDGWLLDAQGRPTTDPGVLYHDPRGTILPLTGSQAYKGFGIGLLLDMLVGGLSGAPCSRPEIGARSANAVVFIVIDPAHFAGTDHFLTEVTTLADNVRSCPRAEGAGPITLPGDPERRERKKRSTDGVRLDDGTWGQLTALANKHGVAIPTAV
jgi:uncharacterized oxidoreductase